MAYDSALEILVVALVIISLLRLQAGQHVRSLLRQSSLIAIASRNSFNSIQINIIVPDNVHSYEGS